MASEGGQDNKQHCNSSAAKAYQDQDTHTKRTSFTAERPRQGTRHGCSSQPVALAHHGQGQQVLSFLMLLGRTSGLKSALHINAKPNQLHRNAETIKFELKPLGAAAGKFGSLKLSVRGHNTLANPVASKFKYTVIHFYKSEDTV